MPGGHYPYMTSTLCREVQYACGTADICFERGCRLDLGIVRMIQVADVTLLDANNTFWQVSHSLSLKI